ncbi:DUF6252 family protein [Polluticoccus soli]|uniref:DUF6252 family protein n=1 Tax=Polluticoccus soli TaxID=3034150 RepID=UPI0023E0A46D|nr:DUF6252 family protein [Flavipsychrobacter sp. JY13-12]
MKYLLVMMISCLAITGCKKDSEKMPKPTQSGKNILACEVNGKVHIYEGKRSYLNSNGVDAARIITGNDVFIEIHGDNADYDDDIEMRVVVYQPELNKEYIFSKVDSKDWAEYYVGQNSDIRYKTQNSSGFIKFSRFDPSSVAGTFMFTGYNQQGEKVEITEGFFDIVPENL